MTTTTTSWHTSGDIPPGPWAQLVADTKVLLGAMAAAGAKVTGPDGTTGPELGDTRVAFIVTAADRSPLTVRFTREAHQGSVQTAAPLTTGLVLVIVDRAATHWGRLVEWTSDADVTARATAEELTERLFGPADRAVTGAAGQTAAFRTGQIVYRTQAGIADTSTAENWPLLTHLDAVIAGLTAERAGVAVATTFAPTPAPQEIP